jgi:hypothetical protein
VVRERLELQAELEEAFAGARIASNSDENKRKERRTPDHEKRIRRTHSLRTRNEVEENGVVRGCHARSEREEEGWSENELRKRAKSRESGVAGKEERPERELEARALAHNAERKRRNHGGRRRVRLQNTRENTRNGIRATDGKDGPLEDAEQCRGGAPIEEETRK